MNTQPPFGEYRSDHQRDPSHLVMPGGTVVCVSHGASGELTKAVYAEWFAAWKPYLKETT